MLHIRLRERRKEKKYSQEYIAEKLGMTRQGYGHYETGRNEPDADTIKKLSEILECTTDYLHGKTDNPKKASSVLPNLTKKDERDIAKKLEAIINDLESETSLAFDGEPMDEHTRELVLSQIESNLQLAKRLAKKKFTPKKYRND